MLFVKIVGFEYLSRTSLAWLDYHSTHTVLGPCNCFNKPGSHCAGPRTQRILKHFYGNLSARQGHASCPNIIPILHALSKKKHRQNLSDQSYAVKSSFIKFLQSLIANSL